jgi:hypothetical protein
MNTTEETVECHDGTTQPAATCVQMANGEWAPTIDCLQAHDGTWFLENDDDYIQTGSEEWALRTDCVECYDGDWNLTVNCLEAYDGSYFLDGEDDFVEITSGRHRGEYAHTDELTYYDGGYLLSEDCTSCDGCGESTPDDELERTEGSQYVCPSCVSDNYYSCDSCGDLVHYDNVCSRDDGTYCSECCPDEPDEDNNGAVIKSYSDKSSVSLPSESKDILQYGIELEVEGKEHVGRRECADWVRTHLPASYAVFKEDGSLGSKGFEIVTRWDSGEVHKREFDKMLTDSPGRYITSWKSGDCGMHIHVRKKALTGLQIGKMLCFVNSVGNRSFIEEVAGRSSNNYSRLIGTKKVGDGKHESPDRREGLNVTSFSCEFRIFRGTLKRESWHKNLEFVQALVEFCKPADRSIHEAVRHDKFVEWVAPQHKKYPHLHAWMVARGYCNAPKEGRKPE